MSFENISFNGKNEKQPLNESHESREEMVNRLATEVLAAKEVEGGEVEEIEPEIVNRLSVIEAMVVEGIIPQDLKEKVQEEVTRRLKE